MKKRKDNFLQNYFTAYLVQALDNRIASYLKKKDNLEKHEYLSVELLDIGYTDFDMQYQSQEYDQYADKSKMENGLKVIMESLGKIKLIEALASLKDRERAILMARIFGELSFGEIGDLFNMKPKQAEMAYYYIIRKLRKKLEE